MNTGIIIQARTGSSRLPNKMVMPFYENKGVLELLIEKLINKFNKFSIVVATTKSKNDDIIENIALEKGVFVYRGSEINVLSRYIEASEINSFNKVIRICADNPFLLVSSVEVLINEIEKDVNYDYVSFEIKNKPTILSHYGFWAEAISVDALKRVSERTNQPIYLEHVTNFIYSECPNDFKIKLLKTNNIFSELSNIRLTIDTINDFKVCKKIYSDLENSSEEISFEEILDYINENDEIRVIMKKEIIENEK